MQYRIANDRGKRVLIAEGGVGVDESSRLAQALAQSGPIEEVWFNSPGGVAVEGPRMGRILRSKGLLVRLKANNACISACSYAFLGGAVRIVEPGGYYGVHMFSSAGDTRAMLDHMQKMALLNSKRLELIRAGQKPGVINSAVAKIVGDNIRIIEQDSAKTAAIRARYLVEMSLSLEFMTDAFGTSSSGVCYLSPAGLIKYNVYNAN